MSKYLKRADVAGFYDIDDDMRQVFHHEFNKNVYKNEIIKMKQEGSITEEDLKVAKLLFKYRFATLEQIHEAVDSQKTLNAFYSRLEKLLQYRIINKFMLSHLPEDRIQSDAFTVYCLDVGGHSLLTHFSNEPDLLDWFYILNVVTSELIARNLMVMEVSNAFKRTNPSGFRYFKPAPELRLGTKTMIPAFEIAFEQNGRPVYFLGEVMRKQDTVQLFRDKALKWNQLLKTNTWRKYYGSDSETPPVLLVVTADDGTSLLSGKVLHETAELDVFRLTTEERIKKALYERGVFLKYSPAEKRLKTTAIINFRPDNYGKEVREAD